MMVQLVLDFGYSHLMDERESKKALADVLALYSRNRLSSDPFALTLCDLLEPEAQARRDPEKHGIISQMVHEILINNRAVPLPCEYTSSSVTDVFPREDVSSCFLLMETV